MRLGSVGVRRGSRMLSVAKLTLGQEAYYEQQVARGLDDYYAGRGESPGIWAGSGSAGLGLVGVVDDGDLGTLLRGLNPDGEWRALDGEAILKTYRLAGGYLYEAQLRHELTRRLGLEWTEPVKGMGEIAQVPEGAIRAFSTRRQSIVEHMQALGSDGFAAARVAALATREANEEVDLPNLREEWKARAAEHGLGRRELENLVPQRTPSRDRIELEQLAAGLFAPDGLTGKRTTFTIPELVQAVAGALPNGAHVEQVLEAADDLSRFPGLELVQDGDTPGRP